MEVKPALGAVIIDAEKLRRRPCVFERVGNHNSDGLAIVVDLGAAKQLTMLKSPLSSLPAFSAVTMASTPGAALAAAVSMSGCGLGDGRADHITIGRVRYLILPFMGVPRGTRNLARTVDAINQFADNL